MTLFEAILAGISICLAVAVVTLCSMLIGAYKALEDMDDDLAKTRGKLDAALASQRLRDGPARLPFWGVRRG